MCLDDGGGGLFLAREYAGRMSDHSFISRPHFCFGGGGD